MKEPGRLPSECIIPAAGTSSRMGEPKQLLPYRGRPLIIHPITAALEACERVILVTGHQSSRIMETITQHIDPADLARITTVYNSEYEHGMFSSIQCGLRLSTYGKSFILLADLPDMNEQLFYQLWDILEQEHSEAARPMYGPIPGHPVLLTRHITKKVLDLPISASMQQALQGISMSHIETDDAGSITDIDTPEAYADLIRK
jgi:molybdenum cofactor cytidylyltransferase